MPHTLPPTNCFNKQTRSCRTRNQARCQETRQDFTISESTSLQSHPTPEPGYRINAHRPSRRSSGHQTCSILVCGRWMITDPREAARRRELPKAQNLYLQNRTLGAQLPSDTNKQSVSLCRIGAVGATGHNPAAAWPCHADKQESCHRTSTHVNI